MFFVPATLFAQTQPSVGSAMVDLIRITTNPEMPGPFQLVTVKVESYAVDVNSSRIIWYVNKEAVEDGVGKTEIKTAAPDFGKTTIINAVITDRSGKEYIKEFKLRPIEVDLMWEAETYTPPFYKGKALPTYKSNVRVFAIPRFFEPTSDPTKIAFNWRINYSQGAGEGLGRNVAVIPMNYSGARVPVTVEVTSEDGDTSGRAEISVKAVDPVVVLYEDAPLLGARFARAIENGYRTLGNEFRIRAVPYFFSRNNLENGEVMHRWTVNGREELPQVNQSRFTLLRAGAGDESYSVGIRLQNRARVLQEAHTQKVISFSTVNAE
jgi:hypothetical protein